MAYKKPDERRSTERYPVRLITRIRQKGQPDPLTGWVEGEILSISISGIFIASNLNAKPGSHVEIEVPFQNRPEVIGGEIKWRTERNLTGFGIAFTDLTPEMRDRIAEEATSGYWLAIQQKEPKPSKDEEEDGDEVDFFTTDMRDVLDDIG